jgi:type VI secretion system protein ImpH
VTQLFEEGYRFDFFQAVRILERAYPERASIGSASIPAHEVIRFHAHQSLSFPPSAIHSVASQADDRRPLDMTVAFMGLTGPQGVLPRYYTELVFDRLQAKDRTLSDFLDLFNHRIISLFYRAWAKHHCMVGFERWLLTGQEDRLARCLFAVAGLGTAGLRQQLTIDDRSVLRYVGLLGLRPHSAETLAQCLSDYFDVPARITQCIGAWMQLDEADWTRIGITGINNILGQSTLAGTKIWDQQAAFRVELGPLEYRQFQGLLPSGQAYPTLIQLTKLFAGPELDFTVRLDLKADEVPMARLRSTDQYEPRLGWTTWLKTKEFHHNAQDVYFSASAVVAQAGTA